ncbi:MAG TPA: acetyl-CoA carboxylase biotin carboxyl carrier protein subunit [Ktedonobacterales bacterium]|jgi:biotin carboxyl carrier protein
MVRERADRNSGSAPVPTSTSLSVAELRQLITLMEKSDIEEITIEHEGDGLHLTLRKPAPVELDPSVLGADELLESAAISAAEPSPEDESEAEAVKALDIRSTLVGFYRAVARRGAKPLVPGDSVKEGQIIGAVEALNVLNEVESPAAGRVRKILVDDGQPVQYGQVLMKVEPLKA